MRVFTLKNISILLLALSFFPFLYLSFFSIPIADDFAFAHQFKNSTYFSLIKETYFLWGGRYIAYPLIYLNPISFDSFFGYKLYSFFIIMVTILTLHYFIKTLGWFKGNRKNTLIASLILSLIYFNLLPSISEHIYWFTGSVAYHLGIIFSIIFFVLLIKLLSRNYVVNKKFNVLLCLLILFISMGFNEGLSVIIFIILLIITLICATNKKPLATMIWLLIPTLFFLIIMLMAPGNFERITAYENSYNFYHSFISALAQTARFSFKWMFSTPLVLSSLIYFIVYPSIKSQFTLSILLLNKWVSLLLVFVPLMICSFLPYWATGILGQYRTINVALFFFLVFWFINLTVWFNYYSIANTIFSKYKYVVLLLLIISFNLFGNGYNAINDIVSGSAIAYHNQLNKRHNQIINAREDSIFVAPITSKPKTLFILDISEHPNYWTNRAYNEYFEKDKPIILKNKIQLIK